MRLLNISVTSMLAVATAIAIATPAYAAKSVGDVSSQTGETYVAVAEGTVQSDKTDLGQSSDTGVASDAADEVATGKNAAPIDRENAEFIAAQQDKITWDDDNGLSRDGAYSSLTTKDLSALDHVTKNLDNLVGNVVKTAIDEKKVDKSTVDKVIDE